MQKPLLSTIEEFEPSIYPLYLVTNLSYYRHIEDLNFIIGHLNQILMCVTIDHKNLN